MTPVPDGRAGSGETETVEKWAVYRCPKHGITSAMGFPLVSNKPWKCVECAAVCEVIEVVPAAERDSLREAGERLAMLVGRAYGTSDIGTSSDWSDADYALENWRSLTAEDKT